MVPTELSKTLWASIKESWIIVFHNSGNSFYKLLDLTFLSDLDCDQFIYYQIRNTRYLLCTVIIYESRQLPYKAPRFFQAFAIFSSEVHYWSTTTALFLRCSHQSPTIRTLLDHNSVNRLVIQLPPHYLDGIADVPSTQFRTLPPVQIPILEPFIHFVSLHTNLSQFYLNWRLPSGFRIIFVSRT